jgi:hypothetical protein
MPLEARRIGGRDLAAVANPKLHDRKRDPVVAHRRLLFGCRDLGPPKRRELVSLEGLARRREGARRYRGRRRCRIELFLRREAAGEAESGTAILLPRSRARPLFRGRPRRARADT